MRRSATLALLLVLAGSAAQAQTQRYVTDSLRLEARSGPSIGNRIVQMLDSGTPVRVLEEQDGWSRIDLGGGRDAWILSRFLMDEPSARNRVAAAEAAQEAAEAEAARLREQLERSTSLVETLEEERDALATKLENLAREFEQLKRTAASAVAIQEENERLRTGAQRMQADLNTVREELLLMRRRQQKEWFLAGAGVLLGGMLLGLIIPKIRWRRRRSWSEL